jgi:hypothetical protein
MIKSPDQSGGWGRAEWIDFPSWILKKRYSLIRGHSTLSLHVSGYFKSTFFIYEGQSLWALSCPLLHTFQTIRLKK